MIKSVEKAVDLIIKLEALEKEAEIQRRAEPQYERGRTEIRMAIKRQIRKELIALMGAKRYTKLMDVMKENKNEKS